LVLVESAALPSVRVLAGLLLSRRRGDGQRSEVRPELDGVEAVARAAPVFRCELEDAAAWPGRQDTKQVAQVGLGESVKRAGGDERDEGARPLGTVVRTHEEPVAAPDHETAQLELTPVVRQTQSAVVQKASERVPVPLDVAQGTSDRRARLEVWPYELLIASGAERREHGTGASPPQFAPPRGGARP
jgi:hypothetical protein